MDISKEILSFSRKAVNVSFIKICFKTEPVMRTVAQSLEKGHCLYVANGLKPPGARRQTFKDEESLGKQTEGFS